MDYVGNRIKLLRKHINLTQKEFADRIYVTPSYLSRVENGKEKPTIKLIKLICLEFNVLEKWLIYGQEPMYEDDTFEITLEKDIINVKVKELYDNINSLLSSSSNTQSSLVAYTLNQMTLMYKYIEKEVDRQIYLEYMTMLENLTYSLLFLFIDAASDNIKDLNQSLIEVNEKINSIVKLLKKNCSD